MRHLLIGASFILLLVAALPAHAALALEYWHGVQDFSPYTPGSPSGTDPITLNGLRQWSLAGQSPLTSINLVQGSHYIVTIVLRDHDTVGDGSGFTLSGNPLTSPSNSMGLQHFAIKVGFQPATIKGTRDEVANGVADTVTVWGANLAPTFSETNENINEGIQNFGSDYFTIANLMGIDSVNNNQAAGAAPGYTDSNGDVLYPLSNLVVTGVAPGPGFLTLSKPSTAPPQFFTVVGMDIHVFDLDVWGATGTTTFSSPQFNITPVPEPSSLVLLGVVAGLGIYRRRN